MTVSPMATAIESNMNSTCTLYMATYDINGNQIFTDYGEPVFATETSSKCTIAKTLVRTVGQSGDVHFDTSTVIMLPASTGFSSRDLLTYSGAEGPLTGQVSNGYDLFGNITHIQVVIA